jgi:hypothetical protein
MGWAFGRYGGEGVGQENLEVGNHLAELTVDRIRLKWI